METNDDDHFTIMLMCKMLTCAAGAYPALRCIAKITDSHLTFFTFGCGAQGRLATLDNALSSARQFELTKENRSKKIDRIAM